MPLDHPDFGELYPCPACYKPDTLKLCGIPLSQREKTFAAFDLGAAPGAQAAYNTARALARGQTDFQLALLYGTTGNGKTHLLYAATLAACARGVFARFLTAGQLLSDLKQRMEQSDETSPGQVPYEVFWRKAQRWPFLVLDGIGDTRLTEWGWSVLEELVNTRYAEGLPLLASSNLDLTAFPPRMLSRFRDARHSRLVLNEAGDFRPKV